MGAGLSVLDSRSERVQDEKARARLMEEMLRWVPQDGRGLRHTEGVAWLPISRFEVDELAAVVFTTAGAAVLAAAASPGADSGSHGAAARFECVARRGCRRKK